MDLSTLNFLGETEKHKLLNQFNDTDANFPQEMTIHGLFEKQVQERPNQTAVIFNEQSMTYKEMNERANQVAHSLRKHGVAPDEIVGILADRNMDMLISILGVLKAGAAYMPIDPTYPTERILYMIHDSQTKIVLAEHREMVPEGCNAELILLQDSSLLNEETSDLEHVNKPEDLAYIIYTSGSTGKPKGVMIEHRNVIRLLFNDRNLFDFTSDDVWTVFHSFCFDFSVWEMYGALLYGGKIVLVSFEIARDPQAFRNLLQEQKVSILNQTPTAFYQLSSEEMQHSDSNLSIRKIIFGGEALTPSQLKAWKQKYPNTALINMYGITETTVHVTYKEFQLHDMDSTVSNIGKPIPTLRTYVLDSKRNLAPIGVKGELYVSGKGVARGYLNKPELTEERFMDNPFVSEERMYRTGDLARWLPEGELEYLGRIDHQVKIRGYRIELGEIEAELLKQKGIKEAVVLVTNDKDAQPQLHAYLTSTEDLAAADLRNQLTTTLPSYMIPAHFIFVSQMPITPNGKIDKESLRKIEPSLQESPTEAYVAPQTPTEKQLVHIWEENIGMQPISIDDNYFALGGDSIKAIKLLHAINKEFQISFQIGDLYKHGTIREMGQQIGEQGKQSSNQKLLKLQELDRLKEKILGSEK
ncbi:non-ribosomal peptide synthetase [Brevibacillus laterosporus]|uniref:non-ribosomal peptide synthetase n=1 Tax=Brevibacillus laterosporus TaxID=1465 RepID=UPI000EABF9D3|nr:amino acid adenylation domain-containing protein [Brevibacillus laterosporus]AYK06856.1 amino acid adenylation domain-containing protein [Brevibacillus laterosporus]